MLWQSHLIDGYEDGDEYCRLGKEQKAVQLLKDAKKMAMMAIEKSLSEYASDKTKKLWEKI